MSEAPLQIRRDDLRGPEIRALLAHILAQACTDGLQRLWLETGATEHFVAARTLYAHVGFVPCGPFADYADDPHSAFMRLDL